MDKDGKYTILCIDDDTSFREILKTKLEACGFCFKEAVNGKEGIDMVKKIKPDLVLMDVQMPEMNGIEALTQIKANPDTINTKVVFLTNFGEANASDAPLDDKFARDIGASGHIKKTDDLNKIVERIKLELSKV